MADPIRPDNPISHVLEDILGMNKGAKSFQDRINLLHRMSGTPGEVGPFQKYMRMDPYGITQHIGDMTKLDKQGLVALVNQGVLPANAIDPLSKLIYTKQGLSTGANIFFDPRSKALFYGTGVNFTPLPTRMAAGITGIGFNRRRANLVGSPDPTWSSGPVSFSGGFYSQLAARPAMSPVDIHKFIRKNIYQGPLGSALQEGLYTRGMYTPMNAATSGLRMQLRAGANPDAIFDIARKFDVANAAFAQLVKHSGASMPSELIKEIGRTPTIEEAFRYINRWREDFYNKLPAYMAERGVGGLWPLAKPDKLYKDGVFTLPTLETGRIFGTLFDEHILGKGLFQMYKMEGLTPAEITRRVSMGRRPVAQFMTKGMFDWAAGVRGPGLAGAYNTPFRVAVVNFNNGLTSQLFTQEGGAIFTDVGAAATASRLPIGRINLSRLDTATIGIVEKMFGVNLANAGTLTPNSSIGFTAEDFRAVSQFRTTPRALRAKGAWNELSGIQKQLHLLINRSAKDIGVWQSLAEQGGNLSAVKFTDKGLTLDFRSRSMIAPSSREAVLGGRRLTGIRVTDTHVLAGMVRELGDMHGVDLVISADEFAKTYTAETYLTNFFAEVEKSGLVFGSGTKLGTVETIFGKNFAGFKAVPVPSTGKTFKIPLVHDMATAYSQAQAAVGAWKQSTNKKIQKLANTIENGTTVLSGGGLSQLGVGAIRLFTLSGSMRADFMGDINIMKPIRFTPSKMQTIAIGSRLLGYKTPSADPMFNLLTQQNTAWSKNLIGINPATLDLSLGDAHIAKQYARGLIGAAPRQGATTIKLTKNGFVLNGKTLRKLPSMDAFRHAAGGVPFSDLAGTILDPTVTGDIAFLDLGGAKKLSLVSNKLTGVNMSHIPLPFKYMRTSMGINDSLVVGKTHPGYKLVQALSMAETSGTIDPSVLRAMTAGHNALLRKLGGKGGLFEKGSTILVHAGGRARLVPQRNAAYSSKNFIESLYDVSISTGEFEDFLMRKSGYIGSENVARLRETIKRRGFTYAMIGVDPAQRPEHMVMTRLKLVGGAPGPKIGQMNLQMNPTMFRMMERDVDRDVANIIFSEALGSNISPAQFEERLAKQQELASHFAWFYKYDIGSKTDPEATLGRPIGKLKDMIKTFLGIDKSLGYTITRTADRLMPALAAGGSAAAKELGMSIPQAMIDTSMAVYANDPMRLSVAQVLTQSIKQGAVQKAADKMSLTKLGESLTMLGQRYSKGAFNYEGLVGSATTEIEAFLATQGKNREFMAVDYLINKGLVANKHKASLVKMMGDLQRGAAVNATIASEARLALRAGTARLIAEYLAPAYAMRASSGPGPRTIMGVIQESVKGLIDTPSRIMHNIVGPLAGMGTPITTGVGTGARIEQKIASEAAGQSKSLLAGVRNFFEHPGSSKALGIGALLGAAAYGLTIGQGMGTPLPPPIDVSSPEDTGPQVALSSPTRLYTSPMSFNRGQPTPRTPTQQTNYNASFGQRLQSDFTIRDARDPMSRNLIERRMKEVANSDYTY